MEVTLNAVNMVVGNRRAGLSTSQTTDLQGFPLTTISKRLQRTSLYAVVFYSGGFFSSLN